MPAGTFRLPASCSGCFPHPPPASGQLVSSVRGPGGASAVGVPAPTSLLHLVGARSVMCLVTPSSSEGSFVFGGISRNEDVSKNLLPYLTSGCHVLSGRGLCLETVCECVFVHSHTQRIDSSPTALPFVREPEVLRCSRGWNVSELKSRGRSRLCPCALPLRSSVTCCVCREYDFTFFKVMQLRVCKYFMNKSQG